MTGKRTSSSEAETAPKRSRQAGASEASEAPSAPPRPRLVLPTLQQFENAEAAGSILWLPTNWLDTSMPDTEEEAQGSSSEGMQQGSDAQHDALVIGTCMLHQTPCIAAGSSD